MERTQKRSGEVRSGEERNREEWGEVERNGMNRKDL